MLFTPAEDWQPADAGPGRGPLVLLRRDLLSPAPKEAGQSLPSSQGWNKRRLRGKSYKNHPLLQIRVSPVFYPPTPKNKNNKNKNQLVFSIERVNSPWLFIFFRFYLFGSN